MAALRDRAVADLADAAPRELAGLLWGLAAWGERGVPPDDDAFAALAVRSPPPARRTAPCARPAGTRRRACASTRRPLLISLPAVFVWHPGVRVFRALAASCSAGCLAWRVGYGRVSAYAAGAQPEACVTWAGARVSPPVNEQRRVGGRSGRRPRAQARAGELAQALQPRGLGAVLWAFGRMRAYPGLEVMETLVLRTRLAAPALEPQALANAVWACAWLRHHPGDLLAEVSADTAARPGAYAGHQWTSLLWGLTRLGHAPGELFTALAAQARAPPRGPRGVARAPPGRLPGSLHSPAHPRPHPTKPVRRARRRQRRAGGCDAAGDSRHGARPWHPAIYKFLYKTKKPQPSPNAARAARRSPAAPCRWTRRCWRPRRGAWPSSARPATRCTAS